jgi:small-conductance mechanosensitive channel
METIVPEWLKEIFTIEWLVTALHVVLILVIGFFTVKLLSSVIVRLLKKRITPQTVMIIRKVIFYSGMVLIFISILHRLGVELTPILGAAGIAGIALGFASQTSISNLISGLFLISEKPFSVGDVIGIENTTGIILSIDLLSVKVKTFDNRYIRIPNEKLINTQLINITRFPIRRMDINISVAYREDIGRVRELLATIASENPYCLDEPPPLILFTHFGDSGLEFLFGLWFEKNNYIQLKNSIMDEIKNRFDREGIEIPFPHTTIYTGSATEPFPVRIMGQPGDKT